MGSSKKINIFQRLDFSVEEYWNESTDFPIFSSVLREAPGHSLEKMPSSYTVLLETTTFIEVFLYCFVLVYGFLHLPCCQTLYHKWKKWAWSKVRQLEGEEDEEPQSQAEEESESEEDVDEQDEC